MKKPSYRRAVAWIAENDEAGERDPAVIANAISVLLAADLFDCEPLHVAMDVARYRRTKGI